MNFWLITHHLLWLVVASGTLQTAGAGDTFAKQKTAEPRLCCTHMTMQLLKSLWHRWNFADIFGIRKLESLSCRMALFAWSCV